MEPDWGVAEVGTYTVTEFGRIYRPKLACVELDNSKASLKSQFSHHQPQHVGVQAAGGGEDRKLRFVHAMVVAGVLGMSTILSAYGLGIIDRNKRPPVSKFANQAEADRAHNAKQTAIMNYNIRNPGSPILGDKVGPNIVRQPK